MNKLEKCEKEIGKAIKELEKLEADPAMRELYEFKQDAVRYKKALLASAKVEGLTEGIEEGKREGVREIILNMYKQKFEIDIICKIVNLSKEEVKEIIYKE